MTYLTRDGRAYHFCKGCKNKDFTCGRFCPICGLQQAYSQNKTRHVDKEFPRM